MLDHPDTTYSDGGVDFLDARLYAMARSPFGLATTLPGGAYTSEVFQRLENEKVWTREWVCIGTTAQIENPFDLLPYTIGNHAIHVQRMEDGSVIGRFNKAQHGGCRSVPTQCQTGRKTKCSYTSCGFSRDRDVIPGTSLREMSPQMGQYLGMRPERLLPVKVMTVGPLLFANVDPGPDAAAAPEVPDLFAGAVRREGHWQEHRANWKLAGAAIVDAAQAEAGATAVWTFPNLVLVRIGGVTLAAVLQPTAMEQTLWRLSFFAAAVLDDATYQATRDVLMRILDKGAGLAIGRQEAIERTAVSDRYEPSHAAWLFNQEIAGRLTRQHASYWNAPLMRA